MSELISGKDALIELSKDNVVQYYDDNLNEWVEMDMKLHHSRKFRLKPRTITLNGIELPKPRSVSHCNQKPVTIEIDFDTEEQAIEFKTKFSNLW